MIRRWAPIMLVALAGCTTVPPGRVTTAPGRSALPTPYAGGANLGAVMGQNAAALVALFGEPDADVREGDARKLQFVGPICALDAYLYPDKRNAPVVTYLDARQRDGRPIDRSSCIAALTRRDAAP